MLPILERATTLNRGPLAVKWRRRVRPLLQANPEPGMLMVHEIYTSIQGEGSHVGWPCVFVRLSVCHLRCSYCDTRQAFQKGSLLARKDVLAQVLAAGPSVCLITGGEPMLQAEVLPLMTELADAGMTVLLETSGSLDLHEVDPRVVRIIDMKTPSSGEVLANDETLLSTLRSSDEIKFVIGDAQDYAWAKQLTERHQLQKVCTVLMGPVFGALSPDELVAWVLHDKLAVRIQVQLHKYIWEPDTQGV